MIIQFHEHMGTKEYYAEHFPNERDFQSMLLNTMDTYGIDKVGLSAGGPMVIGQASQEDMIRTFRSHPDRIIGFGWIAPGWKRRCAKNPPAKMNSIYDQHFLVPNWQEAVRRVHDGPEGVDWYYEHGFRGLKIQAPADRFDADEFMPLYQRAAELKMPILFHTCFSDPRYGNDTWNFETPTHLERIAWAIPSLNIVGAHMGSGATREAWHFRCVEAIMLARPNLYFDTCSCSIPLQIPWRTEALKKMIWGAEGTSVLKAMPGHLEWIKRHMDFHRVPADVRSLIMGGNAARILGL